TGGGFIGDGFPNRSMLRKKRGEVLEMGLVLGLVRVLAIDALDFEQREKTFLLFGRTNLPGDEIARLQVKAANLRGGDINVLRAGKIVKALGAEKTEAFSEYLKNAFGKEDAAAFGILLEDVENDLVLAHGAEVLDAQVLGHVVEVAHGHGLQLGDIDLEAGRAIGIGRARNDGCW